MAAPLTIECSDLGRAWNGRWVLSGVNLAVPAGGGLLVAGRNGAGKSTLLRLLGTLLRPTRGTMRLGGLDPLHDRDTVRAGLAWFGHEDGLWNDLGGEDHLRIWARLRGATTDIPAALRRFDLPAGSTPVRLYSAGMRRRLSLCGIWLRSPRILLLDEPYSHLDAAGFSLLDELITEHRGRGGAVVAVSHHLDRLLHLLPQALQLVGGRPQWAGPSADLPSHMAAS